MVGELNTNVECQHYFRGRQFLYCTILTCIGYLANPFKAPHCMASIVSNLCRCRFKNPLFLFNTALWPWPEVTATFSFLLPLILSSLSPSMSLSSPEASSIVARTPLPSLKWLDLCLNNELSQWKRMSRINPANGNGGIWWCHLYEWSS